MKKLILLSLLLTNTCFAVNWECINRSVMMICNTWRMEVPSGWIVASDNSHSEKGYYAMTFVPDRKHEWKI